MRRSDIDHLAIHRLEQHSHQRIYATVDWRKPPLLLAIAEDDQLAPLQRKVDHDGSDPPVRVVVGLSGSDDVAGDSDGILNSVRSAEILKDSLASEFSNAVRICGFCRVILSKWGRSVSVTSHRATVDNSSNPGFDGSTKR